LATSLGFRSIWNICCPSHGQSAGYQLPPPSLLEDELLLSDDELLSEDDDELLSDQLPPPSLEVVSTKPYHAYAQFEQFTLSDQISSKLSTCCEYLP
jgi:hypothetical protein